MSSTHTKRQSALIRLDRVTCLMTAPSVCHRSAHPQWDQFEANEKITGRAATYDESVYTTTIDYSKISG